MLLLNSTILLSHHFCALSRLFSTAMMFFVVLCVLVWFFYSSLVLPVAVLIRVFCIPLSKSLMTVLTETRPSRHTPLQKPPVWQWEVSSLSAVSQPAAHLPDSNVIKQCHNIIKYPKLCWATVWSVFVKVKTLHTDCNFWVLYRVLWESCTDSALFSLKNHEWLSPCLVCD